MDLAALLEHSSLIRILIILIKDQCKLNLLGEVQVSLVASRTVYLKIDKFSRIFIPGINTIGSA